MNLMKKNGFSHFFYKTFHQFFEQKKKFFSNKKNILN